MISRERLPELPIYPEQRRCKRPTTEPVLRLFSLAERHVLTRADRILQVFEADFTPAAAPSPRLARSAGERLSRLSGPGSVRIRAGCELTELLAQVTPVTPDS